MIRSNMLKRLLSLEESPVFISTWDTTKTSTGSSGTTSIKLPLISSGNYNFNVNWGDGNSDTITAWNDAATTHTYSTSGTYTISIIGTCTGWRFNNEGDRLKFINVSSWGDLVLTANGSFYGCSNFNSTATDAPTITSTDGQSTFRDCNNFNSNIGNWDVSGITNFYRFFYGCTIFNNGESTSINNWDMGSATSLAEMFQGCVSFNQPIGNWNVSSVTTIFSMFGNTSSFNQDIGLWNVSSVTSFQSMFNNATSFNNGDNTNPINNWNTGNSLSFSNMFSGSNVTTSCKFNRPIGGWDTSKVTTMGSMFLNNTQFNQDIGLWDVSKVTIFSSMFQNATSFNNGTNANPIDNWNTGLATNFTNMLSGSNGTVSCKFNRYIGSWNTSNVTNMSSMFQNNTQFNQDISGWDTSKVTTMLNMFYLATSFNQNLGSWNTGNVTNMSGMFAYTPFDYDIGLWNVSKVTNFSSMFLATTAFNNGTNTNSLENWSLAANNISLADMFRSAASFNRSLNSLNTTNVVNMSGMFRSSTYNQDIGSWNVTKVTNFGFMFNQANSFNNGGTSSMNNWTLNTTNNVAMNNMFQGSAMSHVMSSWNTSKVTTIGNFIFSTNIGIKESFAYWNISSLTDASFAIFGSIEIVNYDDLLINWSNQAPNIKTGVVAGFGSLSKYTTAAASSRALLTRANSSVAISNCTNNGSGLIRVTSAAHGRTTGDKICIKDVLGTTEANGVWTVTVINTTTLDLDGSTFSNTYTSGGSVVTGYGWTITDGGPA